MSRMMAGHFTSDGGTLGGVGQHVDDSDGNSVWLLWMWWRELVLLVRQTSPMIREQEDGFLLLWNDVIVLVGRSRFCCVENNSEVLLSVGKMGVADVS